MKDAYDNNFFITVLLLSFLCTISKCLLVNPNLNYIDQRHYDNMYNHIKHFRIKGSSFVSATTQRKFCPGLQHQKGNFVRVCNNTKEILSGSATTQMGFVRVCNNTKGILSGSATSKRKFCPGLQQHKGNFVRVCNIKKEILSGSATTQREFCPGLQHQKGKFVRVCNNTKGILSGSATTQRAFCPGTSVLMPLRKHVKLSRIYNKERHKHSKFSLKLYIAELRLITIFAFQMGFLSFLTLTMAIGALADASHDSHSYPVPIPVQPVHQAQPYHTPKMAYPKPEPHSGNHGKYSL